MAEQKKAKLILGARDFWKRWRRGPGIRVSKEPPSPVETIQRRGIGGKMKKVEVVHTGSGEVVTLSKEKPPPGGPVTHADMSDPDRKDRVAD